MPHYRNPNVSTLNNISPFDHIVSPPVPTVCVEELGTQTSADAELQAGSLQAKSGLARTLMEPNHLEAFELDVGHQRHQTTLGVS